MSRPRLVVTLLLAGCAVPALAQSKTLTAAADPWVPWTDPENPSGGVSIEIARAALATQGYELKMTFMPWARAQDLVVKGQVDFLPTLWMTEEQAQLLLYSKPYGKGDVKFIKRKGDPFEFSGLESLKGKKVGIIKDYGYNSDFIKSPLFTREEVSDLPTNIRKLLAGHIDLTLEDPFVATVMLKRLDPSLLSKIEFVKTPLSTNELFFGTGLKNPRAKDVVNAFNTGLAAIKANGTYAKTLASHGMEQTGVP